MAFKPFLDDRYFQGILKKIQLFYSLMYALFRKLKKSQTFFVNSNFMESQEHISHKTWQGTLM